MIERQLLFLELNEVNFEYLRAYTTQGKLPTFKKFLENHGYSETTSENSYKNLEPWIQWVTAHTGRDFDEHGVFRLGDIVDHDYVQIWERLENKGVRTGAISPMNAKCRVQNPAFFIPDPWTQTQTIAPPILGKLYRAISQIVNDNAQGRVTMRSAMDLIVGGVISASPRNYARYGSYLFQSRKKPWMRALFLDLLLTDLFCTNVQQTKPQFATLFLNAAAHIQHHYMFSSTAYEGPWRNPEWYIAKDQDPLLDVYELYDHALYILQSRFPRARIMLATGLHQEPHPSLTYYWRIKDHDAFLRKLGLSFESVEPRMSRDFVIRCANVEDAAHASCRLAAATMDGESLFEVDNRGTDLFVMLIYSHDITRDHNFTIENERFMGLRDDVAFVAIKNGQHNGIGYFSDSGHAASASIERFRLKDLPNRIEQALMS
jgi:hypothetical protein